MREAGFNEIDATSIRLSIYHLHSVTSSSEFETPTVQFPTVPPFISLFPADIPTQAVALLLSCLMVTGQRMQVLKEGRVHNALEHRPPFILFC